MWEGFVGGKGPVAEGDAVGDALGGGRGGNIEDGDVQGLSGMFPPLEIVL